MLEISQQVPFYVPPTPKKPEVQYLTDEIIIQGFEEMAEWSKYAYCTNLEEAFRIIEGMKIEREGNEELLALLELYFNERFQTILIVLLLGIWLMICTIRTYALAI